MYNAIIEVEETVGRTPSKDQSCSCSLGLHFNYVHAYVYNQINCSTFEVIKDGDT